ncbi:MAG: ABC-2 family transporter protein [Verrucomicrobiales bacterium]|nr:ABC-2 family transporter protein [Verrucomicrobiales bacterium]
MAFSRRPFTVRPRGWETEYVVRKYWHVIHIALQNTLVYRVNFLFRAVFGLVPLMATIYLWRAVFASNPDRAEVAGYTLATMTSYYLLTTVVDALTAVAEDDWQIAADIRDGRISQFLLKPIDYLTYRLCLFGAGRLVYTLTAALPVLLFILLQRRHFLLPPDGATFGVFLLSTVMTALLQFFTSYTMALLAFWLLEISTFVFILFAFEYVAGGHLFPLDILPPALARVLDLTPFPYQLYFPVSVYLGRVTGPELWRGLAIQAGWVLASYVLARWVWRRGIRHYAAVGG